MAGGSDSRTTTNTTEVFDTTNISIEDVDGHIVGPGGSVTEIDAGAVDAAFEFAGDAVDLGTSAIESVRDVAEASIDSAAQVNEDALGAINRAGDRAFIFGGEVVDEALSVIGELSKIFSEGSTDAIAAVGEASRSDTAQTLQTLIKFVSGAGAVIAVAVLLGNSFKG